MTQLPIDRTPRVGIADARISPGLAGGPSLLGDASRATAAVGDVLAERDKRMEQMERQRRQAAGKSELLIAVAEAGEAASLADPSQAEAAAASRMAEYQSGILDNIQNEQDRSLLTSDFNLLAERVMINARSIATKGMAASTTDQLIGLGERAGDMGDSATVDDVLEQVRPLVGAQKYNDIEADLNKRVVASITRPIEAAINDVKLVALSERSEAIGVANQAINNSGLPEDAKNNLRIRLKTSVSTAETGAVVNMEKRATNLAKTPTKETAEEILGLKAQAKFITDDDKRARLETNIDGILRSMPDKIDATTSLYQGVLDGSVDGKSKDPADHDAVWRMMLGNGDTPEQAAGTMVAANAPVPNAAVEYVSQQLESGSPAEASLVMEAVRQVNPQKAKRMARQIGNLAGASLAAREYSARLGLNEKQTTKLLDDPRYKANVDAANKASDLVKRNIRRDGDELKEDALDTDFVAYDFLSVKAVPDGAPPTSVPSAFETVPVFTLIELFRSPPEEIIIPVPSETEADFHDLFAFQMHKEMVAANVATGNEGGMVAATDSAKDIAKNVVLGSKTVTNTGPPDDPKPVLADDTKLGIGDNPGTPLVPEQSPAGKVSLNAAVADALSTSYEVQLTRTFFDPKAGTQDTEVATGAPRNLPDREPKLGAVVRERLHIGIADYVRQNTTVEQLRSFEFGGKTMIPVVSKNPDGTRRATIGFIEWDKQTLEYRVVFQESEAVKPESKVKGAVAGEQMDDDIFDDQMFKSIDSEFENTLASTQGSALVGVSQQFMRQASFTALSAYGHATAYGDAFLAEAYDQRAVVEGVTRRELVAMAIQEDHPMHDPNLQGDVEREASRIARRSGWTEGLGGTPISISMTQSAE